MTENELEAVHQTLWRLERRWLPPTPDAHVRFAYDPLPIALFWPGVRAAEALVAGRRFLDVGCGIGTKLALMHCAGWEASGMECHEPYAEVARDLIPEAPVLVADAFDVDVFDADLVYMYRPMVSERDEARLERHVAGRLTPGTVLFLPCRGNADPGLEPVAPEVWVA